MHIIAAVVGAVAGVLILAVAAFVVSEHFDTQLVHI